MTESSLLPYPTSMAIDYDNMDEFSKAVDCYAKFAEIAENDLQDGRLLGIAYNFIGVDLQVSGTVRSSR